MREYIHDGAERSTVISVRVRMEVNLVKGEQFILEEGDSVGDKYSTRDCMTGQAIETRSTHR